MAGQRISPGHGSDPGIRRLCKTLLPVQPGFGLFIYAAKWYITAGLLIILGLMLKFWFTKPELKDWVDSTWWFMKQIFSVAVGAECLVAGFLLGPSRASGADSGVMGAKSGRLVTHYGRIYSLLFQEL